MGSEFDHILNDASFTIFLKDVQNLQKCPIVSMNIEKAL